MFVYSTYNDSSQTSLQDEWTARITATKVPVINRLVPNFVVIHWKSDVLEWTSKKKNIYINSLSCKLFRLHSKQTVLYQVLPVFYGN